MGRIPSSWMGKVRAGPVLIEDLRPGDWVLSHVGQPHRVLRLIHKPYSGLMIGLRRAQSPETVWLAGDHRVLCWRRTQSYGGENSWKHVPREHFGRARELRRELTPAEKSLWDCLRCEQAGVKFRRQHPIGPYIADFYSREAGLVVEVDGDSHFTSDAQAYDAERTAYLESLGLNVLRFTNLEVRHEREGVMMGIARALEETRPSEDPVWQWRRVDSLRVGDVTCCLPHHPPKSPRPRGDFRSFPVDGEGRDGVFLQPAHIASLEREETTEEVYYLEVDGANSYLTEVCVITTAAPAPLPPWLKSQ